MMMLDASTMVLTLALGNLALCALLTFYGPQRSPAMAAWSLSKQIQGGAWLLLAGVALEGGAAWEAARRTGWRTPTALAAGLAVLALGDAGVVPAPIAVPGGYALLLAGVALEGGAAWEAARRPGWRTPTALAAGLAVLVFFLCYLVDEDGLRAVAASLLLGAFYLSGALALGWRWSEASLLQRFLALASAVLALVVAARGLSVLLLPRGWGWLTSDLLGQLSSGALYLLMLANGFGALLLGRERLQDELHRLEIVDPLTNVPNRRGFFQLLAPWMALARRPGQPTALVVLDLDGFKRVNDSYGHPAGDVVLRQLVEVCRRQLRDSDQLGRLVGAEFAILLPRTGLDEAMLVAERVRGAIAASAVKSERALIKLTASFGVTALRAEDTPVTLLQRADEALAAAKQGGRNRVEQAGRAVAQV